MTGRGQDLNQHIGRDPMGFPFAIAVTRVLDVPALFAIAAWVSRLA